MYDQRVLSLYVDPCCFRIRFSFAQNIFLGACALVFHALCATPFSEKRQQNDNKPAEFLKKMEPLVMQEVKRCAIEINLYTIPRHVQRERGFFDFVFYHR